MSFLVLNINQCGYGQRGSNEPQTVPLKGESYYLLDVFSRSVFNAKLLFGNHCVGMSPTQWMRQSPTGRGVSVYGHLCVSSELVFLCLLLYLNGKGELHHIQSVYGSWGILICTVW